MLLEFHIFLVDNNNCFKQWHFLLDLKCVYPDTWHRSYLTSILANFSDNRLTGRYRIMSKKNVSRPCQLSTSVQQKPTEIYGSLHFDSKSEAFFCHQSILLLSCAPTFCQSVQSTTQFRRRFHLSKCLYLFFLLMPQCCESYTHRTRLRRTDHGGQRFMHHFGLALLEKS